jgi:mannose-6-phosphate isomerase-like protein (cupin superfamily)
MADGMIRTENFFSFDWTTGKVADCDPNFPTTLHAWDRAELVIDETDTAYFGFVQSGEATVTTASGTFTLKPGMYFSANDTVTVSGGRGIIMARAGHQAFFTIGGPVEDKGRLKYIDGCTDSLLIAPVKLGDPCLNLLYFPPGIDQTSHTHPSDRIGVVFSGRGECVTPEGVIPLQPGTMFRIPYEGHHKFRTYDSEMRVIAYHPDSDFGPQDENHPMINRTIVDGISAAKIDRIRTA